MKNAVVGKDRDGAIRKLKFCKRKWKKFLNKGVGKEREFVVKFFEVGQRIKVSGSKCG